MATGWICLHRQIFENWIWEDKPFAYGQAWIDILLLANHDNNKFLLGSDIIEVERGEFITSELKLMERWGWSKTKVRNFLHLLEKDKMIIRKADHKKTAIKVLNYGAYNNFQTTKRPQEDHTKTSERPYEDTNNNDNNVNNDNNINARRPYGMYNNVYLSKLELEEMVKQYPNDYVEMIENLSTYMRTHGKLYQDHFATMMKWKHDDEKKKQAKPKENYDYRKDVK